LQLRSRHLPGWAGRCACGGSAQLGADHGGKSADAKLRRHHRRWRWQFDRHPAGRSADRCRSGHNHGVLARRQRGGHLHPDGAGAPAASAWSARRRRTAVMIKAGARLQVARLATIWLLLLAMPVWLPAIGGYMALGTRVVVLGLAAMSLNFLLGFTGVLSFGHAAYFGLGAYGTGLALKHLTHSTPLAVLLGVLLGGLAGALLGALIVRRRGVYFAMVTIAFGQVFYFIAFQWSSLTGGDDGLRGFSRQPLDFGWFQIDILSNTNYFYYFVLFCF